ncbi:MAG: portal protein [Candidatus Paceibacterota bacterium]|jgi:hypothetical protein
MASLFDKLNKLFSSSVIIHNVGGKLHVLDQTRSQAYGNLETNFLKGPYTKLYSTANMYRWPSSQNYLANRLLLFRDYELMDTDSIIASALDIYADEVTLKDEFGDTVKIKCDDKKVKGILENLFGDIINIDFNLWPWVRNLAKMGDFYLKLEISEKYGIVNIIPLSPYEVTREEGYDPENPQAVRFIHETALGGMPTRTSGPIGKKYYHEYEMIHFRLLGDTNYLPYGKSMIEPARRVWKQLNLMEDAMLIHRIMRAPEKRVFSIDVGNIAPGEVDGYMMKIMNQSKKVPYVDPQTGDYNLRFNMMNMIEDFWLPVRGGDTGTKIESLKGLEYGGIEDVQYLRQKLMSGLKIPKAFLGYEESIGSKATLASEDIRFARTIERIQRIVLKELYTLAFIHLYAQGCTDEELVSFELEMTSPSIVYEQEKISLWTAKVDLADKMKENKMFGKLFMYKKIFNMSEVDIAEQKVQIAEDAKEDFRMSQISTEGNDPAKTGQSFGTRHDLATLKATEEAAKDRAVGISMGKTNFEYTPPENTNKKEGRPPEHKSDYETDNSVFGRDPIGKKELGKVAPDNIIKHSYQKNSPLSIESVKKMKSKLGLKIKTTKIIQESLDFDKNVDAKEFKSYLDENNIKEDL